MSGWNQKVSVPKQTVSSTSKSPPLPFFFPEHEHFSYIYWFSSSSFREYSQMCKATSNSNISWSKKWNLHLTAFFNNVQSPFNRKMEQSANRKRKGLIKTHQSQSWRYPRYGNQAHAELGGAQALQCPQPLASTDRRNRSRITKRKYFSLRSRVLAIMIHQLAFLFVKENKASLRYIVMDPFC